jgi:hypothetical protein
LNPRRTQRPETVFEVVAVSLNRAAQTPFAPVAAPVACSRQSSRSSAAWSSLPGSTPSKRYSVSERERNVPRLLLSRAEAARSLGVCIDFFETHVQPELRLIRRGRLVLVPTAQLEAWVDRNAARTLEAVS